MIKIHQGNILTGVDRGFIVHGCNAQGVMGSGIAKDIRDTWPQVYEDYKKQERYLGLNLGNTIYTEVGLGLTVVSAITQECYGRDKDILYVDYDAVSCCFEWIKNASENTGWQVHFPLIGCGLANGKWEEVSKRIEAALGPNVYANLWLL